MKLGPVEYVIIGFPGNKFSGKAVPELAKLIDQKLVRVLDLIFVGKDADGNVAAFEFDQLDELAPFASLEGEVGGVLSPDDVDHVASLLEPNSSAALLVWEDLWAAPFVDALREADGVVLEGARVPYQLIEAALEGAPDAV